MKTVCITGHRPKGFPWDYECMLPKHIIYIQKLRETIKFFALNGYIHFISGGAIGVDLDFANLVLEIRKDMPIKLEIAVPCDNQDKNWTYTDKKIYKNILKKADEVTYIGKQYTLSCMQKRNEYMVDNSNMVLAVWNGEKIGGTWNTIRYAKKHGKPINYIYLQDIAKI